MDDSNGGQSPRPAAAVACAMRPSNHTVMDDSNGGQLPRPVAAVARAARPSASTVNSTVDHTGSKDNEDDELPVIQSIWQDDYIELNETGKSWKCLHCNASFSGRNATKAFAHVAKLKGKQNIRVCRCIIPAKYAARYQNMAKWAEQKKATLKRASNVTNDAIAVAQSSSATVLMAKKHRKYGSASSASCSSGSASAAVSREPFRAQPTIGLYCDTKQTPDGPVYKSNEALLEMACADLIHPEGLPFNLAQKARFNRVLTLARCVGSGFTPPDRNSIAGELLEINYKRCQANNETKLKLKASIFGFSILGDGATIKRMPLINVLGSAANEPSVVLEIHDCSGHMAVGGKKDAPYIAGIFLPHLEKHDPNKCLADLVFFDGASNVQKAGRILEAKYPRLTCLHGAEHCVALFFTDIADFPQIKVRLFLFFL